MRHSGIFLRGRFVERGALVPVRSPFDGAVVSEVRRGGPEDVDAALTAAEEAVPVMAALPGHRRAALLDAALVGIAARREALATCLVEEAGKPRRLAEAEVARCLDTFTNARDLARYGEGDLLNLDAFGPGERRFGLVRRFPVGVVAAISPFNFPLNLVAHKIAPAIAAGCPIVLKPASQTPSPALALAEILAEAGLPDGALGVVPCGREAGDRLVEDPRPRLLTFTGSAEVGWGLKARAGRKKVVLELGGNAAAIVEPDADLAFAAARLALGAFAFAGQSCISVQRVFAHTRIVDELRERLVAAVARDIRTGDPRDPEVVCGPLVTPADADRIVAWTDEAVRGGARRACGGARDGSVVAPIVLEHVPEGARVVAEEVFGPVLVLAPYEDFEAALRSVNASRFGLQAGIFTNDIQKILRAFEVLEVGGVVQGDYPTLRVDHMPYGGVKDSGFGREGVRYAMEEMTEPRLLVLSQR